MVETWLAELPSTRYSVWNLTAESTCYQFPQRQYGIQPGLQSITGQPFCGLWIQVGTTELQLLQKADPASAIYHAPLQGQSPSIPTPYPNHNDAPVQGP